ncbi:hypothetical protein PS15m_009845 [Mucor circinelloides]
MLLPFLGSALKNLPPVVTGGINTQASTLIFVNDVQQAYNTQPRIINQYYKKSSMLKRQFQSTKFNDAGFRPLHPIDPRNSDCLVEESSFIIKSFASQEVDKRTARRYLYSLENAPRSTKLKGELVLIRI